MKLRQEFAFPLLLSILTLAAMMVSLRSTADDHPQSGRTPPKVVYAPDPTYPKAARRDRVQGTVVVQLHLDAEGAAHEIKVVRGLRPDLDASAIEAVGSWKFEPAKDNGKPVSATINVEVAFRLY
jgi:protein TonB